MPSNSRTLGPNIVLAVCFIISMLVMWPGIMSMDALGQYGQAIQGIYNDHHPPIMSFIWRYFDKVYPGPGLLFSFHLVMLYTACWIFIYIFRDSKFKWWYALMPLVPNILAYTPLIVKDLGFSFSYLLASAIMAYLIVEKVERYRRPLLLTAILLLFYGTAVKFQAKFILLFFCFGVGYCVTAYKFNRATIITSLLCFGLILQGVVNFNSTLVPNQQKSHSWQMVKLYDLAAMSMQLDKEIFPSFVHSDPNYSFAKLKSVFNHIEVDSMIFDSKPVLRCGSTAEQRAELKRLWQQTVVKHPGLYLKVRSRLWFYNFISTPSGRSNPAKFLEKSQFFSKLLQNKQFYDLVGISYELIKISMQAIWLMPLPFLYLALALRSRSRYRVMLLIFNAASITFFSFLFVFSMYATARYLFLVMCLLHASHGFAWKSLRELSYTQSYPQDALDKSEPMTSAL